MKFRMNNTAAAIVLTAAAITVPCTAWYVVGSRSAAMESKQFEKLTEYKAFRAASSLAERTAGRLEAIRDVESRRPVYQYEHIYHDPRSSCECASIKSSPLSRGPEDSFIQSHFQIQPGGLLTLPTLSGIEESGVDGSWIEKQWNTREVLGKVF